MKSTLGGLALLCLVAGTPVRAQDSASESTDSQKPSAVRVSQRDRFAQLAVVLEPVTLAPDAKVDPDMEADCRFEEALGTDVGKMLRHYHLGGGKVKGTEARVLRISIVEVTGKTGGAWSGSKSMRIHAALLVDGKPEREADMYRYNTGANPFRGTCHVFRQHTKRLGKDLASWIKNPSYKVDNPMLDEKDDSDVEVNGAPSADLGASATAH